MNAMPLRQNSGTSKEWKELEKKIKKMAKSKMTKEEIRAQKISYVHGSLPKNIRLTREEVEKIVDEGVAGVLDIKGDA